MEMANYPRRILGMLVPKHPKIAKYAILQGFRGLRGLGRVQGGSQNGSYLDKWVYLGFRGFPTEDPRSKVPDIP